MCLHKGICLGYLLESPLFDISYKLCVWGYLRKFSIVLNISKDIISSRELRRVAVSS